MDLDPQEVAEVVDAVSEEARGAQQRLRKTSIESLRSLWRREVAMLHQLLHRPARQ